MGNVLHFVATQTLDVQKMANKWNTFHSQSIKDFCKREHISFSPYFYVIAFFIINHTVVWCFGYFLLTFIPLLLLLSSLPILLPPYSGNQGSVWSKIATLNARVWKDSKSGKKVTNKPATKQEKTAGEKMRQEAIKEVKIELGEIEAKNFVELQKNDDEVKVGMGNAPMIAGFLILLMIVWYLGRASVNSEL